MLGSVEIIHSPLKRIDVGGLKCKVAFPNSLGQEGISVFPRVKLPDYIHVQEKLLRLMYFQDLRMNTTAEVTITFLSLV